MDRAWEYDGKATVEGKDIFQHLHARDGSIWGWQRKHGFFGGVMKMFWTACGDSCTTLDILKTAELYTFVANYKVREFYLNKVFKKWEKI